MAHTVLLTRYADRSPGTLTSNARCIVNATSFGIYRGDGKPQRIRIRFAPAVARNVEESHWHHSQTLNRLPDGYLDFEATLTTFEELKSWLLSFGRHAEVLSPKRLREEMALEIRESLRQYEHSSTHGQRSTK